MRMKSVEQTTGLALGTVTLLAAGLWGGPGWHPLFSWFAAVNVVTAFLFWIDKRRAMSAGWRIPESILLLLAFLGGWPAGLAASQILRHKTAKASFRGKFWGAVVLHLGMLAGVWYWAAVLSPPDGRAGGVEIGISEKRPAEPWPRHHY